MGAARRRRARAAYALQVVEHVRMFFRQRFLADSELRQALLQEIAAARIAAKRNELGSGETQIMGDLADLSVVHTTQFGHFAGAAGKALHAGDQPADHGEFLWTW